MLQGVEHVMYEGNLIGVAQSVHTLLEEREGPALESPCRVKEAVLLEA